MTISIEDWLAYVFDRKVEKTAWYFDIDEPDLHLDPTTEARLYAETFERSAELLAPFTPAQINQGLHYLTSNSCSDHMFALIDRTVDQGLRLRAIRSFVPLFRDVIAKICTPSLGHRDEPGASPLNSSCYMWWDNLPLPDAERWKSDQATADTCFDVMRQLLNIRHDAVRESALHGLGHWHFYYPRQARGIVRKFLNSKHKIRRELREYAENAADGAVL